LPAGQSINWLDSGQWTVSTEWRHFEHSKDALYDTTINGNWNGKSANEAGENDTSTKNQFSNTASIGKRRGKTTEEASSKATATLPHLERKMRSENGERRYNKLEN
jgi:hypothetical protein